MSLFVTALALATTGAARTLLRRRRAAQVRRRLAPGVSGRSWPAPPAWFVDAVEAAAAPVAAPVAFAVVLAASGVAAVAGAATGGLPLAVVGAGAVSAGAALALRLSGDRADRRYEAALPVALESCARSLRSGASLLRALHEAGDGLGGPVGADLGAVAADAHRGRPLADALAAWPARRPLPGVRLAAAALVLGVETGGARARAVDGVAATLRERAGVAGEVRALAAQARLSALVIALAPLAFGAVTTATDPQSASFLFRTPAGLAVLVAGLALDATAAVWMARLTRSVAP